MKLNIVIAVFVSSILSGCAAPQISLSRQAIEKIDSVDGILVIPQSNLAVNVPPTNMGNTGLIGALIGAAIDSSRQSQAERTAQPIIENLRSYSFRDVMLDASNEAFSKISNVKFSMPLSIDVVASDSARRIAFDRSNKSAVLFGNVNYELKLGNLHVYASVDMFPKANPLKAFRKQPDESEPLEKGNAIYRKSFSFVKHGVSARTVKYDLSEAARSLAKQIADDIGHGI